MSIVHRILSPENIIIKIDQKNQMQLKLVGFGNACLEKNCNLDTEGVGAAYYLSPETF